MHVLSRAKGPALIEQGVDECRLSVVDVRDDRERPVLREGEATMTQIELNGLDTATLGRVIRSGTSTTPSIGPPIPPASIKRNAPTIGEPSSVLIAAKLPAEAITTVAVAGASRLTRCTARTPMPLPIAMRATSAAMPPKPIPPVASATIVAIVGSRSSVA